jgi:hypothetical protein
MVASRDDLAVSLYISTVRSFIECCRAFGWDDNI